MSDTPFFPDLKLPVKKIVNGKFETDKTSPKILGDCYILENSQGYLRSTMRLIKARLVIYSDGSHPYKNHVVSTSKVTFS